MRARSLLGLGLVVVVMTVLGVVFIGGVSGGQLNTAPECSNESQAMIDTPLPASGSTLATQQQNTAKAMADAARKAGFEGDAVLVVLVAGVGESDMRPLGVGDAAGPDSRGVLQQRSGWGTEAQRMNPGYAALSFLLGPKHDGKDGGPGGRGLVAIPGWQQMPASAAIHAVQINADPNHYTQYIPRAKQIAQAAGIDLTGTTPADVANAGHLTPSPTTGSNDDPNADAAALQACGGSSLGALPSGPCPLDGKAAPGKKNPADCHKAISYVQEQMKSPSQNWRRQCLHLVTVAYGWSGGPATARQAAQDVIDAGMMQHDTSNMPAGAVMWWDGSAVGNPAGHVAIYDGQGYIYSNDAPVADGRVGRVPWTFPVKSWGQKFLGWSPPYFPNNH